MASEPLVSVVIPAFNASRFIRETLESVLDQTYGNLEIIVVNDGSDDETPAIVAEFAQRDGRVFLYSQERSGLAATRNQGIRLSKGSWIAPLDADDIWYPQKIEKQLAAASGPDAERIGLVYGWTRVINERGEFLYEEQPEIEGEIFVPLLLLNVVGHGSGPLIRRQSLDEVGLYDLSYFASNAQGCEDWDLYLRIARNYRYALVRDFLVGYRVSAESMSRNYGGMLRSFRLMQKRLRRLFPEVPGAAFRWSKSDFYYRQVLKARRSGDFGRALEYAMISTALNPYRLGITGTYRLLADLALRRTPRHGAPVNRSEAAAPVRRKRMGGRLFAWGRERMLKRAEAALGRVSVSAEGLE